MDVFRAKWVLPVATPPIENGAIAVQGGRIAAIGRTGDVSGDIVHDLGDVVLLPGLVNAHTHLELTGYRGRLSPGPLWEWFDHLIRLRWAPGANQAEQAAVSEGARQSLAAGVTCVGDISRTGGHVRELQSSPIRKVCFLELISGALAPPNDAATLARALKEAAKTADARTVVGISPHAPYTVTGPDLKACASLAAEHDTPVTMHLLETREEADWLAGRGTFLRDFLVKCKLPTATEDAAAGSTVERLSNSGLIGLRPLLAHVNYLDDAGLAALARSGASVAYCPRSHRFFGHAPHRWREMLAAGINVCLGTDSLASNDSLSILDELRCLRGLAPNFSPDELLEMGTIRGAIGLRLEQEIGSLEHGKLADFIAIPWKADGPSKPATNVLDGMQGASEVWIEGRRLVAEL